MNKKIEKPNYTQTPNILFDEIMRDLNGAELKVMLAVIRKTFGWHKERDRISLTQLEEMTGLSRQGILNAIHGKKKEKSVIGGLVNKGYIKIIETKQGNVYELVVKEVDQQETASQLSRLEVVNKVDQESGLASQQSRHTKEKSLNKLSKEIYDEIEKYYELSFLEVKPAGKLFIDYPRTRKRIKELLERISKEDIIGVIEKAKADDWIKDNGFQLSTILSDFQVSKLLNGKTVRQDGCSKPQEEKKILHCEKCGVQLNNYICPSCFTNHDTEGNAI